MFVTDGTPAGTARLIDINPGPEPSIPILLTHFGEQFLFKANDGAHGAELRMRLRSRVSLRFSRRTHDRRFFPLQSAPGPALRENSLPGRRALEGAERSSVAAGRSGV